MNELKIALGTTSEDKFAYLDQALNQMGIPHVIRQFDVDSEVPSQPLTKQLTETGALNRGDKALKLWTDCDLGVGMEGGLNLSSDDIYQLICVVSIVTKKHQYVGISTQTPLPKTVSDSIKNGAEYGEEIRKYSASLNKEPPEISELVSRRNSFIEATMEVFESYGNDNS